MATQHQPKTTNDRSVCTTSPTGAHYWMLGSPSSVMTGVCKHCHAQREFHPYEDHVGFNNKGKQATSTETFN
jgi:hypothetical protein